MAPLKKIGKYDVIEMIGRGGMGVVFKATDSMLGRLVAIKMMTCGFADDPDLLKRFYREAQSTARLTHPNIVTVYDMGDEDGTPYLVMQFLEGESLHAIIKSRRELSLLTKTNYLIQVCNGLQYAHEQQITHRDVKPGNIMVLPNGTVKIVDFGLARIGNDRLTRPGQVMGSFNYMSPEQIDDRDVDARSDIFSLGIVAYEFLAYCLPFQAQDTSSMLLKILYDSPPPLSAYLEPYPAEFDGILQRALAKKKADRYQTVDEMRFDLAEVERQLRKETITTLSEESERLISEGDWARARERLQHLVKLDPQNPKAIQRLKHVQQEIQKQAMESKIGNDTTADLTRTPGAASSDPTTFESRSSEPGSPSSSAALRAKQLRDKSILELTPPDGISHPGGRQTPNAAANNTGSGSSGTDGIDLTSLTQPRGSGASASPGSKTKAESGSSLDFSRWPGDTLMIVERQLASFIGSMAKILIKKAASETNDLDELYAILGANLESQADRNAFLARKAELRNSWTKNSAPGEAAKDASGSASSRAGASSGDQGGSRAELTPEAIDRAAHLLARHIGPIASVLAKRAAPQAASLRVLYRLLAEHVENKAERARFLHDAGFPE
jgi:serine/threonine protein kinase